MIQIDASNHTARNTETGGVCEIVYIHGNAYTNIAGLLALEAGNYEPAKLRNLIREWHSNSRHSFIATMQPVNFNGSWLYMVNGWEIMRIRAMERKKS